MTLREQIMRAAELPNDGVVPEFASLGMYRSAISEYARLFPLIQALADVAECATMGAFHHDACPWLNGKECCCANSNMQHALSKLEQVCREMDELQSKYDELLSYMPKVPQEPYEKSLAKEIIELRKENERQVLALKNLTEENEHLCAGAREEYNRILEAYNEIKNQHKMLSILSSALEKETLALRSKCEAYEGTLNRIALMQAGALDGTKDFFEFVKCEVRGALKKHK